MAQKRVFQIATRGEACTRQRGKAEPSPPDWSGILVLQGKSQRLFPTRRPLLIPSAYGIWTRLHRGSQDI